MADDSSLFIGASRKPDDSYQRPETLLLKYANRHGLVTGAPGTGKTVTALRVVASRVTSGELDPDDVLLLAPTRRAAARLRDELSAHLRRTTGTPMVRTASSAAYLR